MTNSKLNEGYHTMCTVFFATPSINAFSQLSSVGLLKKRVDVPKGYLLQGRITLTVELSGIFKITSKYSPPKSPAGGL